MKILKIFSMILALHLAVIAIFILSPGCQSTTSEPAPTSTPKSTPTGNWSNQSSSGNYSSSSSSLNPTPVNSDASLSGVNAPEATGESTLTEPTPAESMRSAPTRPNSPEAKTLTGGMSSHPAPVASVSHEATVKTYKVQRGDSLWSISRKFHTSIKELEKLNPGMKATSLRYNDTIKVPEVSAAAEAANGKASAPSGKTYKVRPGDSLSRIAARNGVSVSSLRAANHLKNDLIQVGEELVIPEGSSSASKSGSGKASAANGVSYTIKSGDTLGLIAHKYHVKVSELMKANGISDPRRIRIGQKLVIPGFKPVHSSKPKVSAKAAPAPAPAETTPPPADQSVQPVQPLPSSDSGSSASAPSNAPLPVQPVSPSGDSSASGSDSSVPPPVVPVDNTPSN